jgi:hypothetical protein
LPTQKGGKNMKFSTGREQVAVIRSGGGINFRRWINDYKSRGYLVVIVGEYAYCYSQ